MDGKKWAQPSTNEGDFLFLNGKRYPITASWLDRGPDRDGRRCWGVVTTGEEAPPE